MKLADSTELNLQTVSAQSSDTGLMSSVSSSANVSTIAVDSAQVMPALEAERSDLTMGFFAVGAVINIVMITAYFIWAYKQLKKTGERED